jgi:two-component system, chemotaxis family, sensor kinase CheA
VSGRGVGLDAVRARVESLGGTVSLTSAPESGAQVVVTVPLTLSTVRAMLVRAAGAVVALPTSAVHSLVRISRSDIARVHGRDIVALHDQPVPIVRLAQALGWGETITADQPARAATASSQEVGEPALVVTTAEGLVALTVDELLEERSVVMRAATPRLVGTPALLGTTLLEDGAVALILNAAACARLGLERSAAPGPTEPPEVRRQPVILLAEDTLTTRELERSILESAGYAVLLAGDGAQAWQLLQENVVDAVVSDVNMPRMDGVALCRAIRSSSRLADLPVVLVTSLAGDEDRRRGLDAGADAYLPKPEFGRDELLDTLRRVL